MSTSRLSLGMLTLVVAFAGIVVAAEPSPTSLVAMDGADLVGLVSETSPETSPEPSFPISAGMEADELANGYPEDVSDSEIGRELGDDRLCDCHKDPCWVFRGGALVLQRSTPAASSLVFVPGGPSLLNANDFHFGFRSGFELGAIHQINDCWGIDVRYMQIDSLNAMVGPIVTGASTVDFQRRERFSVVSAPPHSVTADYGSAVRSAEINARRQAGDWLTVLVGFRYLNLDDSLSLQQGPSFYHRVDTRNDLYGGQMGVEAFLASRGRFRLDGWAKAGLYGNDSKSHYVFRYREVPAQNRDSIAGRSPLAFVGDVGVTASYSLTKHISLRGGYQLLWVDGVALASDQFGETSPPTVPDGIAINSSGGVFLHGAILGVEVSW